MCVFILRYILIETVIKKDTNYSINLDYTVRVAPKEYFWQLFEWRRKHVFGSCPSRVERMYLAAVRVASKECIWQLSELR